MSNIGGSGTTQKIKNNHSFPPSFEWRVILPLVSVGFILAPRLILPAHINYRLKLLPYFSDLFVILLIIYSAAAAASIFSRRIREKLSFKAAKFARENPDETARLLADAMRVAGDPLVNARVLETFNYRDSVSQALPALERNASDIRARTGRRRPRRYRLDFLSGQDFIIHCSTKNY
jgi:hypothetical protein